MGPDLPDFDQLAELARRDPDRLEALRAELIDEAIASAPTELRQRLNGLAFQMDAQRRLARDPFDACLRANRLMMESVDRLNVVLQSGARPEERMPGQLLDLPTPRTPSD